jgi:arsenate reductase
MKRQKVLFLCTQNSARSQMAEGFLRHLGDGRFEAYSAEIDPTDEIHPCAIEAMREVGIDISDQHPKGLKEYMGKQTFNYLIIVCARAEDDLLVDLRGPPPRTRTSPTTRCLRGSGRCGTRSR